MKRITTNKVVKQSNNNVKKVKRKQADDKSARIKKAKAIRKLLTWTILIAICLIIFVFLLTSEVFKICNIEIKGNSQVSQETILLLSEIDVNDNIFLASTTKAKNKILQEPYIKEVTVKRELPDKIKIEIIEKEKAYMLQIDEMFAYIDKNGYVLEMAGNKLDNLILLQGFRTKREEIEVGKILNEEDLERLEEIEKILKSSEKIEISNTIASINIKDKNDYILNLPIYNKIVHIGDTTNLTTKMLRTKDILDKTMDKEGKIFVNGKFNEGFDPYFREEANN